MINSKNKIHQGGGGGGEKELINYNKCYYFNRFYF